MKSNWLWDRKISASGARRILKNPAHRRFFYLAALLLARNNEPKEVFDNYLEPLLLCKHWAVIKKRMREDKWAGPRIIFWQAIYERLLEKYRKRGIVFRKAAPFVRDPLCEITGRQIRDIRKADNLSQKKLAKKLDVSQQMVSRIEKGKENISLVTLNNVSRALGKKIEIKFLNN